MQCLQIPEAASWLRKCTQEIPNWKATSASSASEATLHPQDDILKTTTKKLKRKTKTQQLWRKSPLSHHLIHISISSPGSPVARPVQPWHCQMLLFVLILSLDPCHQQQSIRRTEGPVIGQTFHLELPMAEGEPNSHGGWPWTILHNLKILVEINQHGAVPSLQQSRQMAPQSSTFNQSKK